MTSLLYTFDTMVAADLGTQGATATADISR